VWEKHKNGTPAPEGKGRFIRRARGAQSAALAASSLSSWILLSDSAGPRADLHRSRARYGFIGHEFRKARRRAVNL